MDKMLSRAGLSVLDNQEHRVQHKGQSICVIGLADYTTGKPRAGMSKACGKDDNIITVMHSPDSFPLLSKGVALALAGHTHGGQ